jgi:hypothetical protein
MSVYSGSDRTVPKKMIWIIPSMYGDLKNFLHFDQISDYFVAVLH